MTAVVTGPQPDAPDVRAQPVRRRRRLRRRTRDMLLGYALVLPSSARVRHVRLLPVHQELLARPVPHAAVPRTAAALGRPVAVPRRADLAPVHEQLQGDARVRAAHRAHRHRARTRARRPRASAPARDRDLPHDLLVDGDHLGCGRVADLADAPEPADRAAELLARPHRQSVAARRPEVGAGRGGRRHDLAEPRTVVHHHVGRSAGRSRRAARGRDASTVPEPGRGSAT